MEENKKIKKLLHILKHTEEHLEELIKYVEECNYNPEPYKTIYNKLKEENDKLREKLRC